MARRRARGEGSIRKRKDGRWEGRYSIGRNSETGRLIYKSVLARTQSECKNKLREALIEQHEKETKDRQNETKAASELNELKNQSYSVEQWLKVWYELYSKNNLKETTQEQYTYFIHNILIPRIGKTPLDQISGFTLQKLYQDLLTNGRTRTRKATTGLSPKTIKGVHGLLRSAFDQAVRAGFISENPTLNCKPPKPEKKEMKVIQPEKIGEYLQAADARNVLPLFFLELTTGLRKGEILALLWTDLDIEKRSITVSKSVTRLRGELKVNTPKTQHSVRTIVIPQQAVDLLQQEHNIHPDNPYMFPSPKTGTMYSPETVLRIHKRILKDAGLETCRFHDLRHTFATLALQNGVDIKTLSETLGHYSSSFTLDVYTHVTTKMQQEAAEKVGQYMKMNF